MAIHDGVITTQRAADVRAGEQARPARSERRGRSTPVSLPVLLGLASALLLAIAIGTDAIASPTRAGRNREPLRYEIAAAKDGTLRVTCRLRLVDFSSLRLLLGSDAAVVRDLTARDETGRNVPLVAVRQGEWSLSPQAREIEPRSALTIRYRLRASRSGREHFTIYPARCLIYAPDLARKRSRVRLTLPSGWSAATALRTVGRSTDTSRSLKKGGATFEAGSLGLLLDSPILIGRSLVQSSFTVGKTRFRLVFSDRPKDSNAFERGLKRIATYQSRLFGDRRPFTDYTFLVSLDGPGTFEHHRNTTTIGLPAFVCASESKLARCLLDVAEGMVRPWFVTAPQSPDVTRRSRSAWFTRGASRYYALRSLQKTRLLDDARVLNAIAEDWVELERSPIRTSLADLSWREAETQSPDDRRMTAAAGTVLALVIDREVRRRTDGKASLDDVVRTLTSTWFDNSRDSELTNRRILRAIGQVVKGDFGDYFKRYVEGDERPDFKATLEDLGYQMVVVAEEVPSAFLLLKALRRGVRSDGTIQRVEGRPWFEASGFEAGDRIVSILGLELRNQRRFDRAFMRKWRAAKKAGRPLRSIEVVIKRKRRTVRMTVNLPSFPRTYAACEVTGDPIHATMRGWSVTKPKSK